MIDPSPASGSHQKPETGYDANIPRGLRDQTRGMSAWAGTLHLNAFLILVVLPFILVTEAWQGPEGAAVVAMACAAARRSRLRYLRLRVR